MELLTQINQRGQTVVLVTHDARLATAYASRVVSLRDGAVVDDTRLAPPAPQTPGDLMHVHPREDA
jgi:putative ABC transport system ATP-binding protein